jgi:hypothetical protein
MNESFKTCPCCKKEWETQTEFISDSKLKFNGYMADLKKLENGLFYFTHTIDGCFSTMVIKVLGFLNLYSGPYYEEQKLGTDDCPGYCLDKNQLHRCEAFCEGAYVREICNIIREKQKA